MGIAEDIILVLLAGLLFGFIAHKARLPLILGYIVAGVLLGPYAGGSEMVDVHQIEVLAEIGVALLLFSIGLDLSFKELREVRNIALIGTPIQLFLIIVYGYFIGRYLDMNWVSALVFGGVLSLSSTMVVFKTLINRGLMGTLSSRVMVGMLIVQDLAAIPMMILIPQLNNLEQGLPVLAFTLLKAFLFLFLIMYGGLKLVPKVLTLVARLGSRELFLLTITALGLGIGYLSYLMGLSFALGAFTAGLMLSESEYSHRALSDIIPLRDVFGLLFFVSIGMLFNPGIVWANISTVLALVLLVIGGKFVVFYSLSRFFGYFNIVPLAVGLGLAQIGEFSFVLARAGLSEGILDQQSYSIILATAVITMFLSPFLAMLTPPLYALLQKLHKKRHKQETIETQNLPTKGLSGHIVIAGGGRVGTNVAKVLHQLELPFVIIEEDFRRYQQAKKEGFPVMYSDATHQLALEAANIQDACLLLITIPAITATREISKNSAQLNPELHVIARAANMADVNELYRLNIYEIVQPEFEASLEVIRQVLLHLDFAPTAIHSYVNEIRTKKYTPLLTDSEAHQMLSQLRSASYLLEVEWFEIDEDNPMLGKSIQELRLRSRTGVSVVGVLKSGELLPNPGPDYRFAQGDIVAVIGKNEHKRAFVRQMGLHAPNWKN